MCGWRVSLLYAIACAIIFSRCVSGLNEEGELLLKWKQDFVVDADDSLSNWNASDSTPCFWNGVQCTQGSVFVLDFSSIAFCNLVGDIHALTFAKFANLTTLNVGNTSLNGNFPQDIVNCPKLVYLNLSFTFIGGELPENLTKLQHLQALDLSNSGFEGSVVTRFDELQELRVLRLGWNHFEGQVPESILALTKLEELTLSHNNWNGTLPLGFFTIPNLTVLWLGSELDAVELVPWPNVSLWESLQDLRLEGVNFPKAHFPTGILKLTELRSLYLERCNIFGPIPSLESLPYLEKLIVAINKFSGQIPDMFGSMPNLSSLDLGCNNFSGEIPPSLGLLSHLVWLDLSNNHLKGRIPPEIANWRGLTKLRLSDNELTGEIPYDLGRNTLLAYVDLGNNRLEGPIPPYLCWGNNMTLQYLGLYGNMLTGTIPETYGNCTNLSVVRLDGNQLDGSVPAGLWEGAKLVTMQLSGNHLSGSIDARIGMAKSLSTLELQDNVFSGPIPGEIGQTSLVKFLADSNKFNGSLTPLLGSLSSLTELGLSGNSFSGAIPASLGNCTELVQVDMARNNLDGAIPDELSNLTKLSTLDLSENNLTGTIPLGFLMMVNLRMLNVAFNNLSMVIPNDENCRPSVTLNFTGNPYMCVEGAYACGTRASAVSLAVKADRTQAWILVVVVLGAVGILVFVVGARVFTSWTTEKRKILHSIEDKSSWKLTLFQNKVYHEDEITALEEENLIGAGGSAKVYKVILSDGEVVAVKKLWNVKKDEGSHDHGYGTELKALANIRHRHIVKLLCSCTKGDSNLLVYEYMPNGSLGDLLHGSNADALPWEIRLKIAVGAAMGLEYLHDGCSPQILHRDIKSNNILVDLQYEAHLADFGIARMVEMAASQDLSSIAGSLGYIPPEYSSGMRVTEKIDVYSFGVVLLELVTGKCAADLVEFADGMNLVEWVQNRVVTPEGFCEILDSKCGTSSESEMLQVLEIAMSCTNFMPKSRPSMHEVVKLLEDIVLVAGMSVGSSNDGEELTSLL